MQAGLVALSAFSPSPGSLCEFRSSCWPHRSSTIIIRASDSNAVLWALHLMLLASSNHLRRAPEMQLPGVSQQRMPPALPFDCLERVLCRYCSELLIDAYRYPAVDSPHRNHTYIEAVTCYLGEMEKLLPVTADEAIWDQDFTYV